MAGFENTKDHWVKNYPGSTIPEGIIDQINADLHPVWTPYNEQGGLDVWVAVCHVPYVGTALAGFGNTPQDAHAQLVKWARHVGAPIPPPLDQFVGSLIFDGFDDEGYETHRRRTFDEAIEDGGTEIGWGWYRLYKFATPYVGPIPGEIGWGVTRHIRPDEIAPPRPWWERYATVRLTNYPSSG